MDTIFRHFVKRDNDDLKTINIRKGLSHWFVESFPVEEFSGEDALMHHAISLSNRVGIVFSEKYLEIYIKTELKAFIYRNKISVEGTEGLILADPLTLEQAAMVTADVLRACYYEMITDGEEIEDFPTDIMEFIKERRDERVLDILSKAHETASGLSSGMIGSEDAVTMINYESQAILEVYNTDKLEDLGDLFEELSSSTDGKTGSGFKLSFKTGIAAIDNDTLGFFTSRLYGIEAPPGAGKTRFVLGVFIYNAAVHFNKNCVYHTLEQQDVEIKAILISLHVYHLFNKIVPDNMVLMRDMIKDPEIRKKVDIAEADLFDSGKYGRIKVKHHKLFLESFISVFKREDKLEGGYDVYAVDYMALIEQDVPKPGSKVKFYRLDDWKIVQQGYRKFKSYVLHNNKVGIAINQLNAEGVELANAGKDTNERHAQGGIEVYRSTDWNSVIGGTEEMKAQQKRRLHNPKKRSSKGFGALILNCYIEIALFFESKGSNL